MAIRLYSAIPSTTPTRPDPTKTVEDIEDRILKYLAGQPAGGAPAVLIFHDIISITL